MASTSKLRIWIRRGYVIAPMSFAWIELIVEFYSEDAAEESVKQIREYAFLYGPQGINRFADRWGWSKRLDAVDPGLLELDSS